MRSLRAFGVLSQSDEYWQAYRDESPRPDPWTYDPLAKAADIAAGYLRKPGMSTLFDTILPVAGMVGLAARTLTDNELELLGDLSKAELANLVRGLRDRDMLDTRQSCGV